MAERQAYIAERNEPGVAVGRLVTLDDRIVIDEFCPEQSHVLWHCDNCERGYPVTAQFATNKKRTTFVTICATCLQRALDGIAFSLANPVTTDEFTNDPDSIIRRAELAEGETP